MTAINRPILFSVLIMVSCISHLSALDISGTVREVIKASGFQQARVGVWIQSLDSPTVCGGVNSDSLFNPASLTKLFTGFAAFDHYGPTHTFSTKIYTDDSSFTPDNGTINGTLYIKGGGDPELNAERMWLFAWQLRLAGIRSIKGDIILDATCFDNVSDGPGYEDEATDHAYDSPVCGLSANFNTASLQAMPASSAGKPLPVVMFPPIDCVRVINKTVTTKNSKDPGLSLTNGTDASGAYLELSGTMNMKDPSKRIYKKIDDPAANFSWVLSALLPQAGIAFAGKIHSGTVPTTLTNGNPLTSFESDPLSHLVNGMFKYSVNFTAEMLLKNLGADAAEAQGTFANGTKAVMDWWHSVAPDQPLVIENGSGMGKSNRTTPFAIVKLLTTLINTRSFAPEFITALPVSGLDGTLHRRFKQSPLCGWVRGKTGTINTTGIGNLAGFVTKPGCRYAYAILITDPSHSMEKRWELQQKILEAVTGTK